MLGELIIHTTVSQLLVDVLVIHQVDIVVFGLVGRVIGEVGINRVVTGFVDYVFAVLQGLLRIARLLDAH